MTVHYLARGSSVAHSIEANVAESMHFSTRVKAPCLRCGEMVKAAGSWKTGKDLWEGVTMCEKAKEATSDEDRTRNAG